MHICIICNEYPAPGVNHGGIGTVVKSLAEGLVNKHVDVSVVGIYRSNAKDFQTINGVSVYQISQSRWRWMKFADNAWRLNKMLRRIHAQKTIDILESQEDGFAFVSKIKGVQHVLRLNGGHHFFADSEERGIDFYKGTNERRSFSKADFIIATSKYVLDHTHTYMKFRLDRSVVILNGTDTREFTVADQAEIIRGRIVFTGSLKKKKGIVELLNAFPIIKKSHPGATLMIAGGGIPAYVQHLETLVPPDMKNSVVFRGRIAHHEIPALLASAEVCVFPSYMEAMPLAWQEALACGKPFVGSSTGPGPEVVKDGETGLLCDPYSPGDIADKINFFLDDAARARTIGLAARRDAEERFSTDLMISKNLDFFSNIIEKAK